MFEGIDEIDWASMEHAYGPAVDVPGLIRGLADPDPAVREKAYDGFSTGGVHHQGDVYDCTVAAVPFLLEALTTPTVPDRHLVAELLASIGGAEDEDLGDQARALIGTRRDELAGLLADPDPAVRAAMPELLAVDEERFDETAGLLRDRLAVETDEGVRQALTEGIDQLPAF